VAKRSITVVLEFRGPELCSGGVSVRYAESRSARQESQGPGT